MIRNFLFVLFFVLVSWFLYDKFLKEEDVEFLNFETKLQELPCDLNIQKCSVIFKDNNITFELTPKPIMSMKPVYMNIYGLDKLDLKKPSLEFYGLNMDMGRIKAKIKDYKSKQAVSKIVISSCFLDVMRYRFDVLDDGKKTGLYIDFDLNF